MIKMYKRAVPTWLLLFAITVSLCLPPGSPRAVEAAQSQKVTVYRDEFGVPHIFAATLEAAAFAVGYAQAEDRLEDILKDYRLASGTMAEVFGPNYYSNDLIQHMVRHAEVAREKYKTISPEARAIIEAFQAGIKAYMKEHPEQVPSWAPEIHPWDVVALSRQMLYAWAVSQVATKLAASGIRLQLPPYRGSNAMLIGARRSALGVPITIIDPHLNWYDQYRFYPLRIYAGDFQVAGVAALGLPLPLLGHNRYCAVAMTTGGPDCADAFEEEVNPKNPRQYLYDRKWRDMEVHTERIAVKNGDHIQWREADIEYSHHGPVVARKGNKAYTVAIPYADQVGVIDELYKMMTAHNLEEMKRALSLLQLMPQNILIGTVQGDIYYVRNGRVPIRPKGIDTSKPIPGSASQNEWQGIHPFSDLVQITNPPSGYMHNSNVTPFAMMKDSPLVPERYAEHPYLYNGTRTWLRHQRGEMITELLDAADKVTPEQAIGLAFNTQVWHAELWQARLKGAWEKTAPFGKSRNAGEVYGLIQKWNRRLDADSEGALAYYAFKKAFDAKAAAQTEPPADLTDAQVIAALQKAAQWLEQTFGSLHVAYGQYFRIGRRGGDRTWPVSGGALIDAGMDTPRSIAFEQVGKEMVGYQGQAATQIVILTNPPQSFAVVPLGVSDRKDSGHWDDQAEKLFSKSKVAPTYFLKKSELLKHVTSTKVLTYKAASENGL
jgi:acyl-homoserine-lactone acylase